MSQWGWSAPFSMPARKAVLVTQWAVDDLATCLLMMRFYQELASSSTPNLSRGLMLAQQWLARLTVGEAETFLMRNGIEQGSPPDERFAHLPKGDRPFAHPRFWAAFKLVAGS